MKKTLIITMMVLILCGCGSIKEDSNVDDNKDYKVIMKEKEYSILDVRTKEEYDELHIRGAINIPLDEINDTINLDKNNNIFVYCRSGNRSSKALNKLKELGYTVYDLGGISSIDLDKVSTSDMQVKKIVDKTKDIKDFTCAEALENFYTDSKYSYYFSCLKGEHVVVVYKDDYEEPVSIALKNGNITIKDLDKYKIKYTKQKNNS